METLSEHSNWIADGTFYVSPRIFPQSYTIHSVVDNKCVPLVYILSGDKKGDTYEFVLNVIKHYFDQHCPVDTGTILIDFEKAVMNAFSNSLPGWEVSNFKRTFRRSLRRYILLINYLPGLLGLLSFLLLYYIQLS